MSDSYITLKTYDEYKDMIENHQDKILYICISATWCKPCQRMKISMTEYMENKKFKNNILYCQIDYDDMIEDDEWMEEMKCKKIPFYIHMKEGNKNDIQTGNIEEWIQFMNIYDLFENKHQIEILEDF
jgi:thiol-disulfide isomerase/thioredoxin